MKNIRGYFWHKHFNFLYRLYLLYYKHKIFFPKKSYSMLGEDLFIQKYFRNISKGVYVDVGAYHPYFWSNTHLLFKNKWKGINIDINPVSIELFKYTRPNDSNINVAISNSNKKFIKYYTKNIINTMTTTNKYAAQTSYLKGYDVRKIKCQKLNYIISKSKFKNQKINFLNIDAEKSDLDVLKSLNFNKYKPDLICVEIHHRGSSFKNEKKLKSHPVYVFLRSKKYKIIWRKEYSFIFSF